MSTRSLAILASAGAGKTYRLANRIVRLLADGAPPASVVALTFTRKAAAEFVSRVLTNLARAAADESEARRLADAIGRPELVSGDFRRLLRDTVSASHRLRFGTLDSFFQSLVRTHPLELGLSGGFTLLDERRAARERRRLLRELLRDPAHGDEAKSFLEAFRLASYGKESRGAENLLTEFAGEARKLYRESGDTALWGDATRIWPEGCPWLPAPSPRERLGALEALETAAATMTFGHATAKKSFETFVRNAAEWEPGVPVSELGGFLDRLLEPSALLACVRGDAWEYAFSKKTIAIPADVSRALGVVMRAVIGGEITSRLRRTEGAGKLVARYDAAYRRAIIGSGLMSFDDIKAALAAPENAGALARAAYRLDGVVKHWLFDEFQDTGRDSWRVMATNADEALDDDSGERSVFFVGDVKQALYGWNGGDHRLLPELIDAHDVATEELVATQRCGPDVLALANAVFDRVAHVGGMPETTAKDWNRAWHRHTCAPRAERNAGYAAWHVLPKPDKGVDADEAKLGLVRERLVAGGFLARGLSCGVLTRTNDEATRAAEYLRRHGVPAVSETDVAPAEDNPVTLALLALVRHAAHPGDTLAGGTVAMSPLAGTFPASPAGRERLLSLFASDGAESALRDIADANPEIFPTDDFSRRRVTDLLDIAKEYDASGERDADAFREFAAGSKRRDTAAAGRVQVMTVHKSKGLEFDAVFLPFLDGDPIDGLRQESFVALRDGPGEPPRAIVSPPPAAICEADPVLRALLETRRAASAYESLCLLYVALTRAKRECFVVTLPPSGNNGQERAPAYPALLAATLEAEGEDRVWSSGDPDWVSSIDVKTVVGTTPETDMPGTYVPVATMRGVTPSGSKGDIACETDGAPEGFVSRGKAFGTEVHRLFEVVERLTPGENRAAIEKRLRSATETGAPDRALFAEALNHVLDALDSPAFRAAFELPTGAVVRNELPFAMKTGAETLLTGTFDRVVLHDGGATLYDFKTDAVATETLPVRYGEPMRLYREAASALFGIPAARIRLVLLHTQGGGSAEVL